MNNNWKTVRIFISSTFLDMQTERDYLIRFVFPRLRERLLAYHIHLVDIDLRWGVTREQDSVEICREVISQCEYFLCMLGGRYGTIPQGKELSITADEIQFGVLDRPAKPRGFALFYFRDRAATAAMVESTPGEFREPQGSDKQIKLDRLKQTIVTAGLIPYTYPAQWDKESRRLTGLKEFGNQVYNDLLSSMATDPAIRDRFTTDTPMQPDEFVEENAAIEAFVEDLGERFVLGSRKPVLTELLAHTSTTGGNGYICLTGASGSGKSALLAYLSQHQSLSMQSSTICIRHFVGVSPGSTDLRQTLRRFCRELKVNCADVIAEIPDDLERLQVVFLEFLRQACARKRVVILLDAIDQFDVASQSAGLDWLPEELPDNARVILSALDGPALEELHRRPRKPREINLTSLTAADGEAIIEQFRSRYHKKFEQDQLAALLAKTDSGTPLYLLAALEELRTLGTYQEISQRIAELPPTVLELFTWILARLENDDGFRDTEGHLVGHQLAPRFSALLGASRYGLSQRELVDLLDAGDPQGNVAALLHLLRPYLMRRGDLLDFYHSQFRTSASAMWLNTDEERKAAHTQLADYFAVRSLDSHGLRIPDRRVVDELPWQLAQALAWDRLGDLLCDPTFIEYAYSVDRFAIMHYWTQVEEHSPLRMINGYSKKSLQRGVLVPSQIDAIASLLMEAGHLTQAKEWWDQLRTFSRFSGDKGGYALVLGRLGLLARAEDHLDEALSYFKEEERIMRELDDWHAVSVSLGNQALIFSDRGDPDTAMRLHKEEGEICRRLNDQEGLASSLGNQAILLMGKGDLKKAMALLKEQERISRILNNRNQLQLSLGNQGIILTAWNQDKEAMEALKQSELICRDLNLPEGRARALFNQAIVLGTFRDSPEEASRLMETALQIAHENGLGLLTREFESRIARLGMIVGHVSGPADTSDPQEEARRLGDLAITTREAGDLEQAMHCYEKQAELYRASASLSDLQDCLGKLAYTVTELGDGERAINLCREREGICKELGDPDVLRKALSLRSDILGYYALNLKNSGRLVDAIRWFEEQQMLCQELGTYRELQTCLGLQAQILHALGRNDDAIALYEQKKAICEEYGFSDGLIVCLENLAVVYSSRHEYAQAMDLYRKAELLSRQIGQADGLILALANQAGLLAQALDRAGDAKPLIDEAMALVHKHSLTSLEKQVERVAQVVREKQPHTGWRLWRKG